jgi:Ca-activated chloride channel family protein
MKTIAETCALFALVLLSPLATAAQSAAPSETPPLMRLADVERGQLLFHTAEPGRYAPAPLVATEVEIEVGGIVARTVVRQHFVNPTDGWLEGRYVFPLPEDSAVNRMTLSVGDRVIEARIAERKAARRTYEQARREGRRAALVEQHRPNVFSNDVANIPPHGRIAVELHYLSQLRYDGGKFSLRFPLVVAPRFDPAQRTAALVRHVPGEPAGTPPVRTIPVRDTATEPPSNPVSLAINLDTGMALASVESRSHAIDIEKTGTGKRRIALTGKAVPADRDFVLAWAPEAGSAPRVAAFRERVGDEIYLLAMILPPAAERTGPTPPRDVVFILDRSGSMGGKSIRAARAALETALDRLRREDRFNLIRFSDRTDALFDAVRPANGSATLMAKVFLRATEADGGTVMRPALIRALGEPVPDGRLRQVVFLTDGAVANETELFREIASRLGPTRLFTVGIGSAPNGYFMRKAAEAGRGTYVYISDLDAVETETARLFGKLENPARTNIEALWSGTDAAMTPETYPGVVPDLYAGEPVVLITRLPAAALEQNAALTLRSGDWTARTALADARPAAGIGALWARAKIMTLTDSRREGVPEEAVAAAVTEVALKHSLVSRYTSLVATERERVRPEGAAISAGDVPLNLPHGWDYRKTMGAALRSAPASTDAARAGLMGPVDLPQGATPFWLHLIAGLGLALLAGLALFAARRPQPPAPDAAG